MNGVGQAVFPIKAVSFHDSHDLPALRGQMLLATRAGRDPRNIQREPRFVS
jgi:hypothetical protein